jgi:hypothetical protein
VKWCAPCRAFLPPLVKKYGKIKERSSDFEIIFVSVDKDMYPSLPNQLTCIPEQNLLDHASV